MVDSKSGKPTSERRSNSVGRELAQLRRRNAEQLAQARERERRVDEALREYATATTRIAAADRAHDEKVRRLRARIDAVTAAYEETVEQDVMAQALAVRRIYDSGRTVRDLAKLLDISQRAVGRLLDRSRGSSETGSSRRAAAKLSTWAPSSQTEQAREELSDDDSGEGPAMTRAAAPGSAHDPGTASGGAMVPTWSVDGTVTERG